MSELDAVHREFERGDEIHKTKIQPEAQRVLDGAEQLALAGKFENHVPVGAQHIMDALKTYIDGLRAHYPTMPYVSMGEHAAKAEAAYAGVAPANNPAANKAIESTTRIQGGAAVIDEALKGYDAALAQLYTRVAGELTRATGDLAFYADNIKDASQEALEESTGAVAASQEYVHQLRQTP